MELWNTWIAILTSSIELTSSYSGLSEAMAIIVFTLIARVLLFPVSFKSAYNMYKNRIAIKKAMPEIERVKNIYKNNPEELAKRTMSIYQKNGIRILDKASVINIGSQGILGLGIFQTLKNMIFSSRFMWIENIAKPDIVLAVLVGTLTFLSMYMLPGAAEQSSLIIYVVPAIISVFVLVSFPSAIGIYWATSNIITVLQTLILRIVISRSGLEPHKT